MKHPLLRKLPTIQLKDSTFIYGIAFFFLFIQNIPFWKKLFELQAIDSFINIFFIISIAIFLFCAFCFIFGLLCWRFTSKLFIIFCILASAATNYYTLTYHIFMDKVMIANIFQTTLTEAKDLLTLRFLFWFIIFGVIPSIIILRIQLIYTNPWWKNLSKRMLLLISVLFTLLVTGIPFYKNYASLIRNNREIVKLITPSNFIVGLISYSKQIIAKSLPLIPIGTDAVITQKDKKKTIFIMVVGETSRAQNFSLNGYAKETNPKLKQYPDLVNFRNVFSCGTVTAISVPCMFSNMTRHDFSSSTANRQENILDIIQRVGIHTYWRDNDSGCKGVCDRIVHDEVAQYMQDQKIPNEGLYYDQYLLKNLDTYINQQLEDSMIILHSNGSHGPAYYQRYPSTLKGLFRPSCDTNAIESCSPEEITNVYDNTILNVDDFLDKTIQLLQSYATDYNVALLYVSDHGESLGEKGFYLHGAPYIIAPKEQTHIPMIFWANQQFYQSRQLDLNCLKQVAEQQEFSHDNIFHSLLSIWHIKTTEYQAQFDIFNMCKIKSE
ncbi:phosphoethanolamine transferase [Pelistega ratti]|uniref:phosphoethanolamine transferase n=1 Tax=Pelistega ratti TaxID=2652177 RepID=UPI00135CBD0E|nr:phosphoethanolamine--lipid A transferase [Pelistega ratti]